MVWPAGSSAVATTTGRRGPYRPSIRERYRPATVAASAAQIRAAVRKTSARARRLTPPVRNPARQRELEGCDAAAAGLAEGEPALVSARHLRDDRGPVAAPGIAGFATLEIATAIRDGHPNAPGDAGAGQDQRRASVLERVGDQVVERLRHPRGIPLDRRGACVPVDANPADPGRRGAPALEAREDDLTAIEPLPLAGGCASASASRRGREARSGHLQQPAAAGGGGCTGGLSGALLQQDQGLQGAASSCRARFSARLWAGVITRREACSRRPSS